MKKLLLTLLLAVPFTASAVWYNPLDWFNKGEPLTVLGGPSAGTVQYVPTLIPLNDNQWDLGTSTKTFRNIFMYNSAGATRCVQITSAGLLQIANAACGSGSGGSGGGTWATTTAGSVYFNYSLNTTDVVGIGSDTGTSTSIFFFDPNNQSTRIGQAATASTTIMGSLYVPNTSQGYAYLGTNSKILSVSTTTLAGQVFPFTSVTGYNSTSTVLGLNGFFSTASSTVSGNFYLPSLTQGFAYIGSSGKVNTLASSSILLQDLGGAVTDSQVPDTITINTAGALSANGSNCSAGSLAAGVDASGASEGCTDVWTEAENTSAGYISDGNTNWDNSYGFTTFAWPFTPVSSGVVSTTSQINLNGFLSTASSTIVGNATTTGSHGAGAVYVNGDYITDFTGTNLSVTNGVLSAAGGGASTTLLADTNYWSAVNRFNYASSTYHSLNTASSTQWFGGGLTTCSNGTTDKLLYNSTTGQFSCGVDQTGAPGGGIASIGPTNQGQTGATQILATSTTGTDFTITSSGDVHTFNLPVASASNSGKLSSTDWTTFNNSLDALGSGYATTTQTQGITFSTSTLSFQGLTVGGQFVPTAGALTFTPTLTGTLNNAGLTNSTISGVALGSNLADLTATDGTLTFSGAYNGGTARTVGLNLGNQNTWSVLQTFNYASTTGQASFVHASTTNLTFGGVTGNKWTDFCVSITGSADLCDGGDATGGGGGDFPFTVNTGYNSTSTTLGFLNGFFSTASSTISGPLWLGTTTPGMAVISSTGLLYSATTSAQLDLLNGTLIPDTGGNSWFQPYSITAANDNFKHGVYVASSTSAKTGFYGTARIPDNYDDGASLILDWTSPGTSGNVVFDFDYRCISGDDAESLDQATFQESVTATDAAPTAADRKLTLTIGITSANCTDGDLIEYYIARDGADAADTLAFDALIHSAVIKFSVETQRE